MKVGAMNSPVLSIIIPAYNEALRLPQTLEQVQKYFLQRQPFLDYEILVVDDGSTDATVRVVQEFLQREPETSVFRLIQNGQNRGKGYSVRHGFQEARGEWVLFSDADLSTPIEEIEKMIPFFENNTAEVVIASRSLKESDIEIRQPFLRFLMGKTFGTLMRILLLPKIQDSQCGFKLFRKEVTKWLLTQNLFVDRFAFDVELLYLANKKGFHIAEVPVRWLNAEGTKVNPIFDPLQMFMHLLLIRYHHRKLSDSSIGKILDEI